MSKLLPKTPPEASPNNAPKPLLTGKLICGGTIILGHLIGKGGFGQVYRAELVRSRAVVAVKVVSRPPATQTTLQRHLHQEIKVHSQMSDDPSVPSLYRVSEDEDNVYLVMEFCDMPTLTVFISKWKTREREPICFESKRSIMVHLIDTIGRCHRRSVYHRDIKPENILVQENDGSIRLIDFGLAVVDPVSSNCRTGTREYMSPECFSEFNIHAKGGTPFDSAANDVWSLGVVLFFFMVGRKLWSRPSLADSGFAEYVTRPETYFVLKFGVSDEAQHLLSRVLEWNPRKRIDLQQFRSELLMLPRFFVPQEYISLNLAAPTLAKEDIEGACRAYRRFFLQRSKRASEAAARETQALTEQALGPPPPQHLLSPVSALSRAHAHVGAMNSLRVPDVGPDPDLVPPSLLPASPRINSQRSLESALLHTPPMNQPLSLPPADAMANDFLQVPANLWHSPQIASSMNGSQANSVGLVGLRDEGGRRSSSPLGQSGAKKKGFFSGVHGVFRLAGRPQS